MNKSHRADELGRNICTYTYMHTYIYVYTTRTHTHTHTHTHPPTHTHTQTHKVRFRQADVDANAEMASEYKVSSLPTCIVFQDEHPIARYEGADLSSLSRHLSLLARGAEEEEECVVRKRQACENRPENRGGKDEEKDDEEKDEQKHGDAEREKFKAKKRRKQRLEGEEGL